MHLQISNFQLNSFSLLTIALLKHFSSPHLSSISNAHMCLLFLYFFLDIILLWTILFIMGNLFFSFISFILWVSPPSLVVFKSPPLFFFFLLVYLPSVILLYVLRFFVFIVIIRLGILWASWMYGFTVFMKLGNDFCHDLFTSFPLYATPITYSSQEKSFFFSFFSLSVSFCTVHLSLLQCLIWLDLFNNYF